MALIRYSDYLKAELNINDIATIRANQVIRSKNISNLIRKDNIFSLHDYNKWNKERTIPLKTHLVNNYSYYLAQNLKNRQKVQWAIWLPSSSINRRPSHIRNYGEKFRLDRGINGVIPGEEYGCKCGIQLIDDPAMVDLRIENQKPLNDVILASILGTEIVLQEKDIAYNKLTDAGYDKYQEALDIAGGSIDEQASRILDEVFINNKKFLKPTYEINGLNDIGDITSLSTNIELLVDNKVLKENISFNPQNYNLQFSNKLPLFKKKDIQLIIGSLLLFNNNEDVELKEFGGIEF